jgi:type I restriction enzyme, S subunit
MNLPSHWQDMPLGKVSRIVAGQSPPSITYNFDRIGLPFLQGKAEFTELYPLPQKHCSQPLKIGKKDSILISVRAPVGDVNVADQDYAIGRGLASVQPSTTADKWFLFFALMHGKRRLENLSSGSTFKSINTATLKEFSVALPPLEEQRAITAVLRTVQDAIAARRQEATLERERKAALMQHLFTHGTRGEKLKDTAVGRIPESWQVVHLEKLIHGKALNGAFIKDPEWGEGIPFVNVADVYKNAFVDVSSVERLRYDETMVAKYGLEVGDILFVRSSLKRYGIGQCCLVQRLPEHAIYDCHLIKVSPNSTLVDPRFIAYFFLSHAGKKSLIMRSKTTTMTTINQKGLIQSLLPKPLLEEQTEISDILSACDNKIMALDKEVTLLNELFQALLEELMSGLLSARILPEWEDTLRDNVTRS